MMDLLMLGILAVSVGLGGLVGVLVPQAGGFTGIKEEARCLFWALLFC